MRLSTICFVVLATLLCSCAEQETTSEKRPEIKPLEYAKKFKITENGVEVLEPWPNAEKSIHYSFTIPPKKVIVTSTTHLPYLEYLQVSHTLIGFPNTDYIFSELFRDRQKSGLLQNVGLGDQLNLELIAALQPDLLIGFDRGAATIDLDKIEEIGIKVVYNSDFLENSALGRAEWIKFFGSIYHKDELADSIFNQVKINYDSLLKLTSGVENRPTVFSGVMYGDTWFLPGGKNWGSGFIHDAGGAYIWESDSSSGWLELSFESVLDKSRSADYWIGVSSFLTKTSLQGQDDRYALFDAFKEDRIFSYSKKMAPGGGFDYFESGYARPDLILADYIRILHPELLPDYETEYFEKIQ